MGASTAKLQKIGVFGGSFDPPHWGHLGVAIEAGYQLSLDCVLLVPSGDPPHKEPRVGAEHRFAMVELAAREHHLLIASRLELDRPGPHYTVQTLEILHGLEPDAELYFIIGSDQVGMNGWREPERILTLARIVVARRLGIDLPGADLSSAYLSCADFVKRAHWALEEREYTSLVRPIEIEWPGIAISSTEIRHRVRVGAPTEYLVPRSVDEYLRRHRLYL